MQRVVNFLRHLYSHRAIIKVMIVKEIQSRYIGTLGGCVWTIINPLMMILVYWFVFSVGFKVRPGGNIPFIVIFLCGFIPWMMFAESLTTSTNSINANSHLVTKTVFPTEILPVVYIGASLVTHAIMLVVFIIVLFVNKIPLSFYNLQFLYYFFALSLFTLGLGWLFSAMNVFFRDIGQIVSVVLNMWFWLTPIVWPLEMLPQKYHIFIKLNPFYYIVQGYRASFIHSVPFWQHYQLGIYFWIICILVVVIGGATFRRLKPEFAEVL